jgi:hypothetical protein
MAVRLVNLHQTTLRVDLRGGSVLLLQPGQRSEVLLEELLYDNTHLLEWEKAGWLMRQPTRLTGDDDGDAAASDQEAATVGDGRPAADPAVDTATDGAADAGTESADERPDTSAAPAAGKKKATRTSSERN